MILSGLFRPAAPLDDSFSIKLPNSVINSAKKYSVFIVKNNKAAKRDLDISYINHINIAVSGGIEIGDTLVVEGQNNLRDNMAVSIIQEDNTL